MDELIGSLLMFTLMTGLVLSVFFVAKQYLKQWSEQTAIDMEIFIMNKFDKYISELSMEGKSSRIMIYSRLYSPIVGSNHLSFLNGFSSQRIYENGNVLAGKFIPMNCSEDNGIFTVENEHMGAEFNIQNGWFNLSDTLKRMWKGERVVIINDIMLNSTSLVSYVHGSSYEYSSPSYCSIEYRIDNPYNMTLKFSMNALSDYVKMEVNG